MNLYKANITVYKRKWSVRRNRIKLLVCMLGLVYVVGFIVFSEQKLRFTEGASDCEIYYVAGENDNCAKILAKYPTFKYAAQSTNCQTDRGRAVCVHPVSADYDPNLNNLMFGAQPGCREYYVAQSTDTCITLGKRFPAVFHLNAHINCGAIVRGQALCTLAQSDYEPSRRFECAIHYLLSSSETCLSMKRKFPLASTANFTCDYTSHVRLICAIPNYNPDSG